MTWNAELRLMAITASHASIGKSSTGETCCTPALFTTMSGPPSDAAQSATIAAISSGRLMSAAL
jgi:hypothetical protein